MDIPYNILISIWKFLFTNKNYLFTKEKIDVMDGIITNYKKLENIQLSLKITYIFNYYYDTTTIRHIISKCEEPIVAFILYKTGKDNLIFNKNLHIFEYAKKPVLKTIKEWLGLLLGIAIILYQIFKNLQTSTIENAIIVIIGILFILPIFYSRISEIDAEKFLNLTWQSK